MSRWWIIEDRALHDALQRAHNGEDPWLIEAEIYANSTAVRRDEDGEERHDRPDA